MTKKFVSFAMLLPICFISIFAVTAATFPYALETADLETGFELISTTVDTETSITQTWGTPSDNLNVTSLVVIKHDDAEAVDEAMEDAEDLGFTSVSVSGADKALKLTEASAVTIVASKGKYVATCASPGTEADVITLLEAQMDKLPSSGSAPGFVLISAIFAIGATCIVLKKAKK